jgi:uncharacterized protein
MAGYERLETIDVLRGLALFGIIAANIRGFAGPAAVYFEPSRLWSSLSDRLAQALVEVFIQGKFITIFALLFGVGFAVQLSRAEARGAQFSGVYARRLLVLAGIGLVHGLLIWWGDILLPYAVTGLLLFFFRHRRDRTVLIWAVAGYLWPLVLMLGFAAVPAITGEPIAGPEPPTPEAIQKAIALYRDGSWLDITRQRAVDATTQNWFFAPFFLPNLLGLFLFGMLAWRWRLLLPTTEDLPRYRAVLRYGLVVGVIGNATIAIVRWFVHINPMVPSRLTVLLFAIQMVAVPALTLAYVCATILLMQDARWRSRLSAFAAVGRMALSNYLFQSVVATLLFYSYGLRLFGRFGPALLLVPTFVIYGIEPVLSRWWIARFRFGPTEWLWRSLTYGRLQPMRRDLTL